MFRVIGMALGLCGKKGNWRGEEGRNLHEIRDHGLLHSRLTSSSRVEIFPAGAL